MGREARTPKKSPTITVRCRALVIQMVLEQVDAEGQVIGETVTQPQRLFPKFWADLPAQVEAAVTKANAERA